MGKNDAEHGAATELTVTKAFIPVAGYGTRRLPISKAIEKCMLPVGNRPIVDYVVQDCLKAGIREIHFIVDPNSSQLRKFYTRDALLEQYLALKGKNAELAELAALNGDAEFYFHVQPVAPDAPYGTTVGVGIAAEFVQPGEKALVIMGDQFIYNADDTSETGHFLVKAALAGTPSAMLGVEVLDSEVHRYGILKTQRHNGFELFESVIEKPLAGQAPSNLNNASFYLFDRQFFDFVRQDLGRPRPAGLEYMLTDVLNAYVAAGHNITVVRNHGEYLDCGNVAGWLHANNRILGSGALRGASLKYSA